jgi:hypothetical protein
MLGDGAKHLEAKVFELGHPMIIHGNAAQGSLLSGAGKHWNSYSFESTPLQQDGLAPTCRWFSGTPRTQMHVNEDG